MDEETNALQTIVSAEEVEQPEQQNEQEAEVVESPEPAEAKVETEAETETEPVEDAGESDTYTEEEWNALSEEERQKILDEAAEAEAYENPKVKEIIEKAEAEKKRIIEETAKRERELKERETELNNRHRQAMSDIAGAKRVQEQVEKGPDHGKVLEGVFKETPYINAANPPVDQRTGRPMSPEMVRAENQRIANANAAGKKIVEGVAQAIFESPQFKSLQPIIQERQNRAKGEADFKAWDEVIVETLEAEGKPLTVKGTNGMEVPSPELVRMRQAVLDVGLFDGGSERDIESRRRSIGYIKSVNLGASITAPVTSYKKPPPTAASKIRRQKRPPQTLAGSGQTASQAQGMTSNNRNLLFSKGR